VPTPDDANRLLAEGVAAAQAGQRQRAYNLLLDAIELDRRNELAWLWLSTVTDSSKDQRICLENVLTINPANERARHWLARLKKAGIESSPSSEVEVQAAPHVPVSVTLWPVVAFWIGVSLFFIAGGILSLLRFVGVVLRSRGLQNLDSIQVVWLVLALFFFVTGFTGLSLAWQLSQRRSGGYYGSLLLGLMLVFLGPGFGLLVESPNYVAVALSGLVPAAAVLLTLASMSGFESTYDASVA
jgi:hypothetical protein